MGSQNLVVEPLSQQHFSMFRGHFCAAKEFHFLFTLFCTISILVTCNGYSVKETQSTLSGFEVSGSCNINFETGSQFVFDDHASSELVAQHSVLQSFAVTLDYQANDPYSNNTQFYPCDSSAVNSIYCVHFPSNLGISLAKLRSGTSFGRFLVLAKGSAVKSTCLTKPLFCFGVCSSEVWRKNTSFLNPLNGTLCAVGIFASSSSAFSRNAREKEELVPKHGKFHFSISAVSFLDASKPVQFEHYCFQWISVKSTSPEQLPVQLMPNSGPEQVSFKVFNVTMVWKCVKKMLVFLFASALLYLLVSPLFPRLASFKPEDFRNQKNSFLPAICALESSHRHSNLVICFAMSSKVKIFLSGEEVLFLESVDGHYHDPREAYHMQTDSLSKLSWVENSDTQKESNLENMNVRVGKEKRRKRRKKKSVEVSSSPSSNSSPCSSLSPVASRKPLAQENEWQCIESKCSKRFSKVNTFDHEIIFRRYNHDMHYSSQRKPNLTSKVNEKTVPTCHYPVLASKSKLALHERAPGRRSHNRGNGEFEAMMEFEEKFTYDIWGDHPLGPWPNYKSKIISNNSTSYFARDLQTVMNNSMVNL